MHISLVEACQVHILNTGRMLHTEDQAISRIESGERRAGQVRLLKDVTHMGEFVGSAI